MAFPKTLNTFSINTGSPDDPSTGEVAKTIVNDNYLDMKAYADTWSDKADTFLSEIEDVIKYISDIDTSIPIDPIDAIIPIDLEGYFKNIPVSPIDSSDWIIPIPDELMWNFSEDLYASDLLTKLQDRLKDIVVNGGGALSSVEDQIFARETERDLLTNNDAKTTAADAWAKRGFALPGAGLFNAVIQIDVDYQNKKLDKSRQIAEESRKVEIQMEQHAMAESVKLENATMDYNIKHNDIKLRAAIGVTQYGLAIVDTYLKKLDTMARVYASEVQAYAAQVSAVKSIADIYIAQIEAQIKYALAKIQASIATLDAEVKKMQAEQGLYLEGSRVQAQISAQIAASALSAMHTSASVSASFQSQISEMEQVSESYEQSEKIGS